MLGLWHSFQEGGFMMYPIAGVGVVLLGAAVRFAWRGEHQLIAFIRWTIASVLMLGAFGFALGLMMTLQASQTSADAWMMTRILLTGTMESTNDLAAALLFAALACVGVAVGLRRFPLPNPSAIAR